MFQRYHTCGHAKKEDIKQNEFEEGKLVKDIRLICPILSKSFR